VWPRGARTGAMMIRSASSCKFEQKSGQRNAAQPAALSVYPLRL
jgi:hypothetical protein